VLLPTVAIEVVQPEGASAATGTMVDACTRALAEGRCALAGQATAPVTVTAIVTWDSERHERARIEVGAAGRERGAWQIREVAFLPQDDDPERWRTVGLVVGTLAGRVRELDERPAPPAAPNPVRVPAGRAGAAHAAVVPTSATPRPSAGWIDAAGLFAPGLDDGSWRFGAQLRGALSLRVVPVFGFLSLRYAVRPEDDAGLGVQWATGGAGAGLHVEAGPALAIQPHAELLAELVRASVGDANQAEDAGSRWVFGARFGIDLVWRIRPPVSVFVGADATVLQRDTVIGVRGAAVARAEGFGFSPLLGARVNLP
jgi:hypothetical protein